MQIHNFDDCHSQLCNLQCTRCIAKKSPQVGNVENCFTAGRQNNLWPYDLSPNFMYYLKQTQAVTVTEDAIIYITRAHDDLGTFYPQDKEAHTQTTAATIPEVLSNT